MAHHQRAERNIFCNQVVVCTFPLGNPQAHSSNAQLIRGFKFQFICSNSIAADFQSYLPIHLKYLVWGPIICMHFSDTWWILVHTHTPHPGVYKMTFWRIIILIKNSSNFRKKLPLWVYFRKNSPFEPFLDITPPSRLFYKTKNLLFRSVCRNLGYQKLSCRQ